MIREFILQLLLKDGSYFMRVYLFSFKLLLKEQVVKALAVVLSLVLLALLFPLTGSAHAYIVSSSPASGQTLAESPAEVLLEFNEPIDASFIELNVTGQTGESVNKGKPVLNPNHPERLTAALKPMLPEGVYTAHWRVISGDGHPISGTVSFLVGTAGSVPQQQQPVQPETSGGSPGIDQTVIRWLLYGGFMLFGGLLACALWVFPSGHGRALFELSAAKWLLMVGFALMAAGILLSLPLQVRLETGASWTSLWHGAWFKQTLNSTSFGNLWWAQALLLLPLAFLVYTLVSRDYTRQRGKLAYWTAVTVLAIAAAKANMGHPAAAKPRLFAAAADFLHLCAASVWLGGLLVLVLLLPKASAQDKSGTLYSAAVRRFSVTGALSAALLILTGLYGSILYLPDFSSLTHTTYGAILIAKAALIAAMLVLAYFSYRRGKLQRRLGPAAKVEWAAGICALLLAGLLTNLSPGSPAGDAPASGYVHKALSPGSGYTVTVDIDPAVVGPNHFQIAISDKDGQAADVQQVTVKLTSLEMEMEPLKIEFTEATGFEKEELISMSGKWQADVHVLLQNLKALDASFTFKAANAISP